MAETSNFEKLNDSRYIDRLYDAFSVLSNDPKWESSMTEIEEKAQQYSKKGLQPEVSAFEGYVYENLNTQKAQHSKLIWEGCRTLLPGEKEGSAELTRVSLCLPLYASHIYETRKIGEETSQHEQFHLFGVLRLFSEILTNPDFEELLKAVVDAVDREDEGYLLCHTESLDKTAARNRFDRAMTLRNRAAATAAADRMEVLGEPVAALMRMEIASRDGDDEKVLELTKKQENKDLSARATREAELRALARQGKWGQALERISECGDGKLDGFFVMEILQILSYSVAQEQFAEFQRVICEELDSRLPELCAPDQWSMDSVERTRRVFADTLVRASAMLQDLHRVRIHFPTVMWSEERQNEFARMQLVLSLSPDDLWELADPRVLDEKGLKEKRNGIVHILPKITAGEKEFQSYRNYQSAVLNVERVGGMAEMVELTIKTADQMIRYADRDPDASVLEERVYQEQKKMNRISKRLERAMTSSEESPLKDYAEMAETLEKKKFGNSPEWKDAELLSCLWFWELEGVLKNKVILPLVEKVSVEELKSKYQNKMEELEGAEKDRYLGKWETILSLLLQLEKRKENTALYASAEEALFRNIGSAYRAEDPVAADLRKAFEEMLNGQGRNALSEGRFERMIDLDERFHYSYPVLAEQYFPYSRAEESRQKLQREVKKLDNWIKKDKKTEP